MTACIRGDAGPASARDKAFDAWRRDGRRERIVTDGRHPGAWFKLAPRPIDFPLYRARLAWFIWSPGDRLSERARKSARPICRKAALDRRAGGLRKSRNRKA